MFSTNTRLYSICLSQIETRHICQETQYTCTDISEALSTCFTHVKIWPRSKIQRCRGKGRMNLSETDKMKCRVRWRSEWEIFGSQTWDMIGWFLILSLRWSHKVYRVRKTRLKLGSEVWCQATCGNLTDFIREWRKPCYSTKLNFRFQNS